MAGRRIPIPVFVDRLGLLLVVAARTHVPGLGRPVQTTPGDDTLRQKLLLVDLDIRWPVLPLLPFLLQEPTPRRTQIIPNHLLLILMPIICMNQSGNDHIHRPNNTPTLRHPQTLLQRVDGLALRRRASKRGSPGERPEVLADLPRHGAADGSELPRHALQLPGGLVPVEGEEVAGARGPRAAL